eukprot:CAMPEP_0114500900 /NCGR_PEP_ID=MMETSP0109-20121206/8211_1 /TAXON_ID=29199 /ORGANISM="Chlorarachnion reptans, Strain CCCM449" /LENGTH=36 /DNA_ID= /DNA_START= /DNA_END= /DNA_ORIENTATION=
MDQSDQDTVLEDFVQFPKPPPQSGVERSAEHPRKDN